MGTNSTQSEQTSHWELHSVPVPCPSKPPGNLCSHNCKHKAYSRTTHQITT